jgi:hypothetical protein
MMNEQIKFPVPWRGAEEWTNDGARISDPSNLAKIKNILENSVAVILEHYHFYGSRARDLRIFEDYEDFLRYLKENAIAGDIINAWSMYDLCTEDNMLVSGQCPDEDGKVPRSGAY